MTNEELLFRCIGRVKAVMLREKVSGKEATDLVVDQIPDLNVFQRQALKDDICDRLLEEIVEKLKTGGSSVDSSPTSPSGSPTPPSPHPSFRPHRTTPPSSPRFDYKMRQAGERDESD